MASDKLAIFLGSIISFLSVLSGVHLIAEGRVVPLTQKDGVVHLSPDHLLFPLP